LVVLEGKEIKSMYSYIDALRHTLPIKTKLILFRIYQNMLDNIEFTLVVIDAVIVEKSKTLAASRLKCAHINI
jgi:hypothetical protein